MARPLPHIETVRGDTLSFEITIRDKVTKLPTDITGATVTSQIRVTPDDASIVATATTELTDPTNGVFTVKFADTDMESAPLGVSYFDIEIVFATGETRTLWPARRLKVSADVTK